MRKGQEFRLLLPNGNIEEGKYLGKGMFSTTFLAGKNRVICYTVNDSAKEIYRLVDSPHIPKVKLLGTVPWNQDYDAYVHEMPYYRDISAKDERAWRQMKTLIGVDRYVKDKFWWSKYREMPRYHHHADKNRDLYEHLHLMRYQDDGLPPPLMRAIYDLAERMCDYGDTFGFDFHMKQFGVDKHGRLILRDVCADFKKVREQREKGRPRKQGRLPWQPL